MRSKEGGDSLQNLPKKVLQDLCKRYGLSPYKTKSHLVHSLNAYFKELSTENLKEVRCSLSNSSHTSCKKTETCCLGHVSQCHEDSFKYRVDTSQISLSENAFSSALKSTHTPSFEFSVRSDEGINVFVDLSLSPLDWFKRLEDEVCICHDLERNKFQTFRQELQYLGSNNRQVKSSFLWEADTDGVHDSSTLTNSFPYSIDGENCHFLPDHADRDNGSSGLSMTKPCDVEMSKQLEEKELKPTSRSMNSNDFDASPEKLACSSLVYVIENGQENTLEDQSMKLSVENYLNVITHETSSVLCSASPSIDNMDMQFSDVAIHQKEISSSSVSNCLPNLVDAADSAKSGAEVVLLTSWASEEEHGDIPSNETEDLSISVEKLEEHVSGVGNKRKRNDDDSDKDFGGHEGRILRSARRLQLLPRRSMRLVPK